MNFFQTLSFGSYIYPGIAMSDLELNYSRYWGCSSKILMFVLFTGTYSPYYFLVPPPLLLQKKHPFFEFSTQAIVEPITAIVFDFFQRFPRFDLGPTHSSSILLEKKIGHTPQTLIREMDGYFKFLFALDRGLSNFFMRAAHLIQSKYREALMF